MGLVSGFFIVEISLQKHQEKGAIIIWIIRHSKGTNAFRFNIRWRYYPMHSNAQWCNGKHLEQLLTNFWLYNCVFHQLQTAWPLTKVILDDFHLGWLLVEEISVRCLFENKYIYIYKYICIYIEIVCISKLISITRSCIHEITWFWFRCLNFKAFARFHKNVCFQCWYSNNHPQTIFQNTITAF